MAECLRGQATPSGRLGPLLIDVAYQKALENLVGQAALAQVELSEEHQIIVSFDAEGVAALDRIVELLHARRLGPESAEFKTRVIAIGAVLACAILKYGNSITAFRAGDIFTNFSVYVPPTRVEYFPFHKVHKRLGTVGGGTLAEYYRDFTRDAWRGPH